MHEMGHLLGYNDTSVADDKRKSPTIHAARAPEVLTPKEPAALTLNHYCPVDGFSDCRTSFLGHFPLMDRN